MKPVIRKVIVHGVVLCFGVLCLISTSPAQSGDSSGVKPGAGTANVVVSDSVTLIKQQLMELEKKLNIVTTESEKTGLMQQIEQLKKRLSILTNSQTNPGGTYIPPDTSNYSERATLVVEIDRCNKELSIATTEEQKKSLIEKITALKTRLMELDKINTGITVAPVNQTLMLDQEIARLAEMLGKATTDSEKTSLLEKIELLKKQRTSLENVYVQPPVMPQNEREMLLQQIQDLKKALSVATTEADKALFATKIDYLNARMAHLDSLAAGIVPRKDSVAIQTLSTEIKYIDDLIMQKKTLLSSLLQSGQNDKAMAVEKELTLLLEKRKSLELNRTTAEQRDTILQTANSGKTDSLGGTSDQHLTDLQQRYSSLQSQQDTLRSRIAELTIKITGADSTAQLQELKKQLVLLNEKLNGTIVAMEKIRMEAEQVKALLLSREETVKLKEAAAGVKIGADSLLKIMQERNHTLLALVKNQADAGKITAATEELLALKEEYLKTRGAFEAIRNQIHEVQVENQVTNKALQEAKVELVASDKANNRGLYEVAMKAIAADTSIVNKVKVKLNVTESIGGDVEIVEEVIDQAPSGKKGIKAFDITPSVDLLINMEDAEIALPFDLKDIDGIDVQRLTIHYFDVVKGWVPVDGCIVDTVKRLVIARVTHFSVYGIFADDAVSVQQSGSSKQMQLSMTTRNVNTTVAFDILLPGKTFVRLHIYSLDGRLIAKPIAGMFSEGSHSFVWNGNNGFRSSAARGTYVARLMVKNATVTKAFSLIR